MLIAFEKQPGEFVELPFNSSFVGRDGALHSPQVFSLWTDAQLASIGVYRIEPEAVPARKRLLSYAFDRTNGVVTYVPTYEDIPVTADDVIAERQRRLALGFSYDFGDDRGVHQIGTTEQDMLGWDEVSKFAQAAIALGAGATAINIVTNSGAAEVTALEWQSILVAAAQFRQPVWAASFTLQAQSPIPADYVADKYWSR